MRIVQLTTDAREHYGDYENPIPYFGAAPEALLQGFAALPETEIHVVACTRRPMRSPEKLRNNIWFHSLLVPKLGWMRTLYQGCIRATRCKLKAIQPDIVHGQGTERDCAITAVLSGFPNVLTLHGNMAELTRRFNYSVGSYMWLAGHLENFALARTSGVFCNSAYTERLVKPRARRTWRVANPLRNCFFTPSTLSHGSGRCIIVNVGVICARKRQLELLDVVRRLRNQAARFEFWFVGRTEKTSPYAAFFLDRIKPLEQIGCARYLGEQSEKDLIATLDQAAAFVHCPSEESFGLVVAEALARGLKFFGSRVGGIPDIASDIPDAELFDSNDWTGLGDAIARWIQRGFPKPGSARVIQERYHPKVIAQRHLEIYREVLSTRR